MDRRLELQTLLETICPHVYHQSPNAAQMEYPAIVYERDRADVKFADNRPYNVTQNYSLTLITRDPDDAIREVLAALPMCAHERYFAADSLNHDVFSIYF
jgi:hypothetical protein